MPETKISSTNVSDLTNNQSDYSVDSQETDGVMDQPETEYMNENWPQYYGYYKVIPELKRTIDIMATWTIGKGFLSDSDTTVILDRINGYGKDTFNTILENLVRTMFINGDAWIVTGKHCSY